ncbi:hypothetical protein ATANTOWER_027944, partial [Ataeniobius toweri]|nr:hypothetical protein [Ataeniobius toweri]
NNKPRGLLGGAIAGIVIVCLLVIAAGAFGGYFIYKRRINVKATPHPIRTGQEDVTYQRQRRHKINFCLLFKDDQMRE